MQKLYEIDEGRPVLLGTRCGLCGLVWFPRQTFGCEHCGAFGDTLQEATFDGLATLLSSALIPDPERGDFLMAQLQLVDGPVIRAIVEYEGEPAIGTRFRALCMTTEGGKEEIRFKAVNDGQNV